MDKTRVVIGLSGGIACYKICELVSRLRKEEYEVRVIMTGNSTEFVSPLTFETLSNNRVYCDTFRSDGSYEINHISLSDWADVMVVAPATANIIAKFAQGIADDLLSTTYLAVKCPVIIAPAMNTNMLEHPATAENISVLRNRGNIIIDSEFGRLACGRDGAGRLADIDEIYHHIKKELTDDDLGGKKILVTAGGTREFIDSVRCISNLSSGKMGYALALNSFYRGADVELISTAVNNNIPKSIRVFNCASAAEMRDLVNERISDADILIMSAAVSDYTPASEHEGKIKKQSELTVNLIKTADILSEIGNNNKSGKYLVGFAAETDNVIDYAKAKLSQKNLNMIVANDVSDSRIGFNSDDNAVTIIKKTGGAISTDIMSKDDISNIILDEIVKDI